MVQVDLAYDQVVHHPRRTVHMNLQITGFPLTSGIFQVMPVPENKDAIIGMMWLRDQNPDIDWSTGRITPRNTSKRFNYDCRNNVQPDGLVDDAELMSNRAVRFSTTTGSKATMVVME
ncbi:unnamed protein product [Phytophthora fragariaefolia]|uniref:Unnamed protein product n=1 Tax=Phytophthora fragariaefolia TaxID=1490495 RepID=A0A9W6Y1H1_9STRA|nr:unnamed protein product [Phytophthora fragariaefolia]